MGYQYRLLKEHIAQHLLQEIGESEVPPLKWNKINDLEYYFNCNINGKDERVDVIFEKFQNDIQRLEHLGPILEKYENCFNLVYSIDKKDTQRFKTDYKTLLKILSTVIDILKSFIEKFNPDAILVMATEKEVGSKIKSDLYKAFIDNKISLIKGYSYSNSNKGHVIQKNKLERIKGIHYGIK